MSNVPHLLDMAILFYQGVQVYQHYQEVQKLLVDLGFQYLLHNLCYQHPQDHQVDLCQMKTDGTVESS